MSNDTEKIWVHSSFKKLLKGVAASEDISMLELTKRLADDPDLFKGTHGKKRIFELTFP